MASTSIPGHPHTARGKAHALRVKFTCPSSSCEQAHQLHEDGRISSTDLLRSSCWQHRPALVARYGERPLWWD